MGWLMDRFGPQVMMRIGVVCFGLGFMLLSQIDTLIQLYLAFVVIAVGASLTGHFPQNVLIIHWFEKHRARALSSSWLGTAAGGILVPLVAWSLHSHGWRMTTFAAGLIFILAGWPLTRIMRSRPEEIGETVDGLPRSAAKPGEPEAAPTHEQGHTAMQALRSWPFWLISLGHCFALFAVVTVNVHAITHIKESLGYAITEAALYFTLMLAFQVGGILLGWVIGDRFDKRYIAASCMGAHMVGLLSLAYATGPAMLAAWAVLHGTAWGLRGPFMTAMRADYFGRRQIGMILGLSSLIIMAGQAGGPVLSGFLADIAGNYRTAFTVIALMAGGGSLFFLLLKRPQPRPAPAQ
jgi:MFS family permease